LPGHYIKCVSEASFNSVFEALERQFGNIYTAKFSDHQKIGVILGERYFLRVNSDVAIAIILKSISKETTEVEIISSAGASGMAGITWSAHKAFASEIRDYLTWRFKSRVENETSYFGKLVGETAWKKCPNCRRVIPTSSLECPFCKSKQA
jgi:hypothetical protein